VIECWLAALAVANYHSSMTLKVLIHKAEEGGFWAEVPALPGCVSQGESIDELRANVREAIEGWLLAEDGALKPGASDQLLEVTV
jgi:predicted RNase H-like HicB family nuclease